MPVFRIACAIGLLFVLAPDKTSEVLRGFAGAAQDAGADFPAKLNISADQAVAACRQNPDLCMNMAKAAAKGR
jgi:hypothetical protein